MYALEPSFKILIPNHIAGKFIGKGGINIQKLEALYDASIQVSLNKELYPGTDERIVTISANIDQIIEFCDNMIETILVDRSNSERSFLCNIDFKIIITNASVGLVMGKRWFCYKNYTR